LGELSDLVERGEIETVPWPVFPDITAPPEWAKPGHRLLLFDTVGRPTAMHACDYCLALADMENGASIPGYHTRVGESGYGDFPLRCPNMATLRLATWACRAPAWCSATFWMATSSRFEVSAARMLSAPARGAGEWTPAFPG